MTTIANRVIIPSVYEAQVLGQPVSANRMWRIGQHAGQHAVRGKRRKMYLTDAAAAWESTIVFDVRAQMDWQRLHSEWLLAGEPQLAVTLTFWGIRGDLDNYAKATLDGLKHALEIDDRVFAPVTLARGERTRSDGTRYAPGVRIEIALPTPPTPEPATLALAAEPPSASSEAPGSLRAIDLIDEELRTRLLPPLTTVQVWMAPDYGCVVLMFPPSPLALRDDEWGTFLPLAQARELRDALNALPELQAALGGV